MSSRRGRGHRRAPLVEETHAIDLLKMKEVLCLHRANGRLEWRSPGDVVPKQWLDFHLGPVEPDGSRLLVLDFDGDPCGAKTRVILEETRAGFDHRRWHARCPVCDGLARKIYLTPLTEESTLTEDSTLADRVVDLRSDAVQRDPRPVPRPVGVACKQCARIQYRSAQRHDPRVDFCRRAPDEFIRSRSHLSSLRSQMITGSIYLEAQRRGFREAV